MAANRSPPMWETSQVSRGAARERAAQSGRPRSAQHASWRPWVQASRSGSVRRSQPGERPAPSPVRSWSSSSSTASSSMHSSQGCLLWTCAAKHRDRSGDRSAGTSGEERPDAVVLLELAQHPLHRLGQAAVPHGVDAPGARTLDDQERPHGGRGALLRLAVVQAGRRAAERGPGAAHPPVTRRSAADPRGPVGGPPRAGSRRRATFPARPPGTTHGPGPARAPE